MTRNPTFNKAVFLLMHPASLLALATLALNDFVLKPAVPSWLTGKLSDFALLFLLPWLGLAILAWLVRDERAAAHWVFGGIAAGFALLKLVPAAGTALYILTATAGLPLYTRPDVTDLAALLVLLPAWRMWQVSPNPLRLSRAWTLLLPAAALLAVADAAAPDYGITCFSAQDGRITATTTFGMGYTTTDGGLTWQAVTGQTRGQTCENAAGAQTAQMSNPDGPVQYRFERGGNIERSADGGATWGVEYTPVSFNQVRKAYAEKISPSNSNFSPGPHAALEDPASGNVLFAMGLEGVLVRTPAGEWVWARIGPYTLNPGERVPPSDYLTLLWGEVLLSISAAMLAFSTLALVFHHKRAVRIFKVVIGWLGWLGAAVIFPPALMTGGYSGSIVVFTMLVMGVYVLVSLLDDLISLARFHPSALLPCAGFGLLAGLLFLLPYLGWAAELLPEYTLAMAIAIVMVALTLLITFIRLRASNIRST